MLPEPSVTCQTTFVVPSPNDAPFNVFVPVILLTTVEPVQLSANAGSKSVFTTAKAHVPASTS